MKQAGRVRELACEKWDPSSWRAVQWLRDNQDKFKGKVYEPARLNLFIKQEFNGRKLDMRDGELVNMIEGPITMTHFSVRSDVGPLRVLGHAVIDTDWRYAPRLCADLPLRIPGGL